MSVPSLFFFFFFNDTATTEIYTLSLHDALPISGHGHQGQRHRQREGRGGGETPREPRIARARAARLHPFGGERQQEQRGEDAREDGVAEAEAGGDGSAARERGRPEQQPAHPAPSQGRASDEIEAGEEAQREEGESEAGGEAAEGAPHRPERSPTDRVVQQGQKQKR